MSRAAAARDAWTRLDTLVARVGRRGAAPREIREFWRLYRAATSRLAALQSSAQGDEERHFLNRLVAAAHAVLYRSRSERSAGLRFGRFLRRGWPALVRTRFGFVLAAAGLFAGGSVVGIWYAATDPGFAGLVAGPEILAAIERGEMWTDAIREAQPLAGSFIFSNNVVVGVVAFALGMTAGFGTVWILFLNGVAFGSIAWITGANGMARGFWGFVAAHGALELPAIFLAGAAGLVLGRGILFPGERTRGRSIADAGREALRILAGTLPLFLAAAAIEAWFSPEPWPLAVKIALAVVLFAGLVAWVLSGRGAERDGTARDG